MKRLIVEDREMIVSCLGGETHRARALAAGGSAYVVKDKLFSDLVPTIVAVAGSGG